MNFADNLTLQTIFMAVGALFTVVNAVFAGFMWRMRATFVPRPEIEASFAAVRSENDLRFEGMKHAISNFDERLRKVENESSSAAAEIRGVRDGVSRVERLTTLLIEFRMKEAGEHG